MLRILVTDDEPIILQGTAKVIQKCEPEAEVVACPGPMEALEKAKEGVFSIAFLDIEMPGMTGIELAKHLKKLQPDINIIFATSYSQYAEEAFGLHASGYITKPLNVAKVTNELENLRFPVKDVQKGLRIQTFGNFEVFYDEKPLRFKYSKTKELLAYLVDRNCAIVANNELLSTLWDDDEDRTSYLKQLRKDLVDTLSSVGADDIISVMRGGLGIIPSNLRCDFFEYLAGTPQGINAYRGEYMQQYSWAEVTHGSLEMRDNDI